MGLPRTRRSGGTLEAGIPVGDEPARADPCAVLLHPAPPQGAGAGCVSDFPGRRARHPLGDHAGPLVASARGEPHPAGSSRAQRCRAHARGRDPADAARQGAAEAQAPGLAGDGRPAGGLDRVARGEGPRHRLVGRRLRAPGDARALPSRLLRQGRSDHPLEGRLVRHRPVGRQHRPRVDPAAAAHRPDARPSPVLGADRACAGG